MKYTNANVENLTEEFKNEVKKTIEENKGLFIYGDTGTGKTHAMHALSKGKGKVKNFVELLVEFRDHMQKGCYFSRIRDFVNEDYLFIDDIGAEKLSDFVIEFLYLVINKRYENEKRTVISTNLSLEEFGKRYGDRLLSRIAEMCVIYEMKGEDRRLQR